jgi:hypothetical protein
MEVSEKAYDEIVDLFARGSSTTQILGFRPSEETQDRARYLLDRSKSDQLTEQEAAELDRFGQLEHMMQLVKARARSYVDATS